MPRARIASDLDDTLISTSPLYHQAIWTCGEIIHRVLGSASPYPIKVLDLQREIDLELMKEYDYNPERFPRSWELTYRRLAVDAGQVVDDDVVELLLDVARRFKQGPFTPTAGVIETLNQLQREGHELFCVTGGCQAEELQHRKLRDSGLDKYFPDLIITDGDKTPALRKLFQGVSRTVMVGDSLDHDILPALAVGAIGVLVRSQSWTSYRPASELDPSQYHVIKTLTELPALLATFWK